MTALTGRLGDFSNAGRLTGQIIGGTFSVIGRSIGVLLWGLSRLGAVLIPIGKLITRVLLLPLKAMLLPLKAIGAAWDGIKTIFSSVFGVFKTLLSFSPLGLIINAWGGVGDFFTDLWGGILETAKAALDWLIVKFETVAGFIGKTWKAVTGWFGGDNESEGQTTTSTPSKAAEVALATTLATAPLPAVATVQHTDHSTHSYQLTIQQPGEDAQALTERILAELEQRRQQSQREGLHDGL